MNGASSQPPAIVVGSGFGGLAAAIRLQARGYDTTILEMRDKPGGRAYVFEDKGFIYDAGPTIITAPFLIDELFELVGKRTEDYVRIVPVTPFYRIVLSRWPPLRLHRRRNRNHRADSQFNPRRRRRLSGVRREIPRHLRARLHRPRRPSLFSSVMDMVRVAPT